MESSKCQVCGSPIEKGTKSTLCSACETPHHPECWEFNHRKCAVYGCWKSPFPKRRLGPPQRHADIFNPFVLVTLILFMLAVFALNVMRFRSL